jgi:hypothetical protein
MQFKVVASCNRIESPDDQNETAAHDYVPVINGHHSSEFLGALLSGNCYHHSLFDL